MSQLGYPMRKCKLPPEQVRSESVRVFVTSSELEDYKKLATSGGITVSAWLREAARLAIQASKVSK